MAQVWDQNTTEAHKDQRDQRGQGDLTNMKDQRIHGMVHTMVQKVAHMMAHTTVHMMDHQKDLKDLTLDQRKREMMLFAS